MPSRRLRRTDALGPSPKSRDFLHKFNFAERNAQFPRNPPRHPSGIQRCNDLGPQRRSATQVAPG